MTAIPYKFIIIIIVIIYLYIFRSSYYYYCAGVESVECGPVRPLAAVLVELLVRNKVKDSDAWLKHSSVVC